MRSNLFFLFSRVRNRKTYTRAFLVEAAYLEQEDTDESLEYRVICASCVKKFSFMHIVLAELGNISDAKISCYQAMVCPQEVWNIWLTKSHTKSKFSYSIFSSNSFCYVYSRTLQMLRCLKILFVKMIGSRFSTMSLWVLSVFA